MADDAIAPLRAWLTDWQTAVRGVDFERGKTMCAPEITAFGTVTPMAQGLETVMAAQWHKVWANIKDFTVHTDKAVGAVIGEQGWVATTWDSLGKKPDGSTFRRPGRLTVAFERRNGRWLATHTHFSLFPQPRE